MKLILLTLLFTLSANAQYLVEMSVNPDTQYGQSKQVDSLEDAKKFLIKIANLKNGWRKGEWKLSPESDLSRVRVLADETQEIEYYHPSNWSYRITDITAEVAAKKAEVAARKKERQQLKNLKNVIDSSDLPNWHKKLLKYLIKEIED